MNPFLYQPSELTLSQWRTKRKEISVSLLENVVRSFVIFMGPDLPFSIEKAYSDEIT